MALFFLTTLALHILVHPFRAPPPAEGVRAWLRTRDGYNHMETASLSLLLILAILLAGREAPMPDWVSSATVALFDVPAAVRHAHRTQRLGCGSGLTARCGRSWACGSS